MQVQALARMSVRHSSGTPPVDPPQGDAQEPWIPEYIEKVHKRIVDQFNNCSLPPSKNNHSLLAAETDVSTELLQL